MIIKDNNTGRSHLFECFEKGRWGEVPEEQIQIFLKGNNIGISQDGSYVSDTDGMKLVAAVLNMESSVEWLTYHLGQAAPSNWKSFAGHMCHQGNCGCRHERTGYRRGT